VCKVALSTCAAAAIGRDQSGAVDPPNWPDACSCLPEVGWPSVWRRRQLLKQTRQTGTRRCPIQPFRQTPRPLQARVNFIAGSGCCVCTSWRVQDECGQSPIGVVLSTYPGQGDWNMAHALGVRCACVPCRNDSAVAVQDMTSMPMRCRYANCGQAVCGTRNHPWPAGGLPKPALAKLPQVLRDLT